MTGSSKEQNEEPQRAWIPPSPLREMEQNREPKILVVADDTIISEDVAYHLCILTKRLSSEMLFLSTRIAFEEKMLPPAMITQMKEWMGANSHLCWVPAGGYMQETLSFVTQRIHRVDFAVLVGEENQMLAKDLQMPIFQL